MYPTNRKKTVLISVIMVILTIVLFRYNKNFDSNMKDEPRRGLRYLYQVDMDDPELKNDTFTLISDDYTWEYSLCLKDLEEVEENWILMTFPNPPKRKTYSLLYTPEGSNESHYIFHGLAYDSLSFDNETSLNSGFITN